MWETRSSDAGFGFGFPSNSYSSQMLHSSSCHRRLVIVSNLNRTYINLAHLYSTNLNKSLIIGWSKFLEDERTADRSDGLKIRNCGDWKGS
ncbi:hypothetical protein B296_00037719 [Ensete ventricosum]|uniref:Uncharacterized protein n=1 Tax=Ensete ventricosum TaxID=4639 RepID=A0A426YM16_ENSVE|nr:hypothetical protein B296_00037719 [Ensete ventricosum]